MHKMGNKKCTSDILAYARRATVPLFCANAAPRSSVIQDGPACEGSLPKSPIDLQGSPTAMHGDLGADCVPCSAATAAQMTTVTSIRLRGKLHVGVPHICRRLLSMCVVHFLLPIVTRTAVKGLAWLDIHMLRSMQRTRGEAPQARHQPNKALMRLAGSRISLGRQMRLQLASVARAGFSAAICMK